MEVNFAPQGSKLKPKAKQEMKQNSGVHLLSVWCCWSSCSSLVLPDVRELPGIICLSPMKAFVTIVKIIRLTGWNLFMFTFKTNQTRLD